MNRLIEAVRRLTLPRMQRLLSTEEAANMATRRGAPATSGEAIEAQPTPAPDYPLALRQEHVEGARLFAERRDMVRGLGLSTGGVIAEVGVALGDFSEFLIQTLAPRRFVAIDIWTMHEWPEHWGQPSGMLFHGKTHRAFYEDRFQSRGDQVVIEAGLSYDALERFPDACFDLVYVDAGHDYDNVRKDALVSARKLKPDGTLIFNDYIMYDHLQHVQYGVVQAVNQLVVDGDWRVVGFALNQNMFCDIAIRRLRRGEASRRHQWPLHSPVIRSDHRLPRRRLRSGVPDLTARCEWPACDDSAGVRVAHAASFASRQSNMMSLRLARTACRQTCPQNPLPPRPSAAQRALFCRSGRIEARIGLRMMPTFPRSALSFRTAGFPSSRAKVKDRTTRLRAPKIVRRLCCPCLGLA
jgi:hypothetical protein